MARVARAVFDRVYILFVLAVTAYAERGFLEPERYSLGEVGSGRTLQLMNLTVPVCTVDELLTSDGTQLLCRQLPDPVCDCPASEFFGSGGGLIPLPPDGTYHPLQIALTVCTAMDSGSHPDELALLISQIWISMGCEMFLPPTAGAFVCLRISNLIYCSVLCDYRFEFSNSPRNPYYCGVETGFLWLDFTGQPHSELPDCTGIRHRQRLLHPEEFYLPSPCHGLSENTKLAFMEELHMLVVGLGCDAEDCQRNDVYLQCPSVEATAQFYGEVLLSSPYSKK